MEQKNMPNDENNIPDINKINEEYNNNDDDVDDESIPPLETIETKDTNKSSKQKNIVIPNDDNDKKKHDRNKDGDDDYDDDEEKDGYTDILNNGDLRKKTIRKGNNLRPQRGNKVIIRLQTRIHTGNDDDQDVGTGELIKDETFDRFELDIGDNDLHQGLDLIIPLMEVNEICRAIIKSRFAYGQLGHKKIGIPEDATIDCQIELLEISRANDEFGQEMDEVESIANTETIDERLKIGNYKKTRGNFWFERGEYSMAIQCYKGALKYFNANNNELKMIDEHKDEKSDANIDKINDLIDKRAQTFNNLAATQMKMDAYDTALRSVNDSLLLRPNNVKALFRHAKILSEKGDIEDAIKELKKAIKLDPKSEAITMELNRLNKILIKQINDQKALYRRMMQVKNDDNDEDKNRNKKSKHHSSSSNPSTINCDKNQNNRWLNRLKWPALIGTITAATAAILYQTFNK